MSNGDVPPILPSDHPPTAMRMTANDFHESNDLARAIPVKGNLAGLVQALGELPEWAGVLGTCELDQRVIFRREPPFAAASGGTLVGRPVDDRSLTRIRLWFERALGVAVTRANLVDAVRVTADHNAFHPVRDYLRGLVWDQAPRLDSWLETFARVRPTSPAHAKLVRAIARKWMVSCVARAMEPGCKVDTMLILEGGQGIGKSTALRVLAGDDLFCDSAIDFASKEACQLIQGVWIYELAELDALLRTETAVIKAFLSRAFDRFRVPYGRIPETVLRSVVFCGTVNHGGYLRDRTGNRRFWPARCDDSLDVDGLRAVRHQLWAEARHFYEQGETWHLGAADEAVLCGEHELRLEADPAEERVETWTAQREGRPFTMDELLENALGLKNHSRKSNVTSRVSQTLERLGFARQRRTALPRTYYYARRA